MSKFHLRYPTKLFEQETVFLLTFKIEYCYIVKYNIYLLIDCVSVGIPGNITPTGYQNFEAFSCYQY